MRQKLDGKCQRFIYFILIFLLSPAAVATNGLNLIGFGYESIMMGGADIAVARDSSAVSTNPAGLTQIASSRIDIDFVSVDISETTHSDAVNDSIQVSNDPFYGMGIGFAHHVDGTALTLGFAVSGQGGVGVEYNSLATPFFTNDILSTELFIARVTFGAAYRVSSAVSVGVSLALLRSELNQSVFPDTSSAGGGFFGQQISKATSDSLSVKIGVRYQVDPETVIGVAYTTSSPLDFSGNQFVVDFTALGLGKVNYGNLNIDGQRQPQEFGVGISFQVNKQMLVAVEANWIDWSSALNVSKLSAANPDNPFAPASISVDINNNWRDQWVWSTGVVYETLSGVIIRGGFNYGRNPIPNDTLSPLLATIVEKHLTLGAGYEVSKGWHLNSGIQWDIRNTETSTNLSSPTGSGTIESPTALSLFLSVNRRW